MQTTIMLNEAEALKTWSGMITESTGVTSPDKLQWMSKYCAYHDMNDKKMLNESVHGYAHLNPNMNVGGMGAMMFPGTNTGNGYDGTAGSGDLPNTLLPLALQVAAQTIALDLVNVVPMAGPLGILHYMDYVYEGGRTNRLPNPGSVAEFSKTAPALVKLTFVDETKYKEARTTFVTNRTVNVGGTANTTDGVTTYEGGYTLTYVGFGRLDGKPIFAVTVDGLYGKETMSTPLNELLLGSEVYPNVGTTLGTVGTYTVKEVSTVKAFEDFIPGYAGANLIAEGTEITPYYKDDTNKFKRISRKFPKSYTRENGEQTPSKIMSLTSFTQKVEAGTIQVKGTITREQIQDMKAYGIDAVAQVEAELINELTQHISLEIIGEIFDLGDKNRERAELTEGARISTYFVIDTPADEAAAKAAGYDVVKVGGGAETQGTLQRRILSKILAASNLISNRGRRGPATFAVCGPQVATALQDCAGFVAYPLSNTINQNSGSLVPVGSIAGVNIYTDPTMVWEDLSVAVGRKGKQNEPGIFFMPYLMADKLTYPSEGMEGAPVTSLKSRYAIVKAGHHPELYYYTINFICGDGVTLV